MNSGLRPLPTSMPVDRAAEVMLRRGEAKSFGQACAVLKHQRRRDYGRVEITPASRAETNTSFAREVRLPYRDD